MEEFEFKSKIDKIVKRIVEAEGEKSLPDADRALKSLDAYSTAITKPLEKLDTAQEIGKFMTGFFEKYMNDGNYKKADAFKMGLKMAMSEIEELSNIAVGEAKKEEEPISEVTRWQKLAGILTESVRNI
jgi:hypothetical protein